MASWKEQLRPASFRGVPFFVKDSDFSGGRRIVTHEYPLRDQPYIEDMGLKAREFSIEAYLLGDTYFSARDALISALEQGGPGSLVHPYHGSKEAIAGTFRVRESDDEGRVVRISINFAEANQQALYPSALRDASSLVGIAANNGLLSTAQAFLARYDINLQPQYGIDSLVQIVRDGATLLQRIFGPRVSDVQTGAVMRSRLDSMYMNAPDIARDPVRIVDVFQGTVADLVNAMPTHADAYEAIEAGYPLTSGANPSVVTATRQREIDNRDALFSLFNQTLAIEAARSAVDMEFASYNEAVKARDRIADQLDEQSATAPDAVFIDMQRVRKELVLGVPGEANDLPRLTTYTPNETTPSLVLSHRIYGDIEREQDIINRNRVAHPGFVQGSRQLEILSHE